MSNSSDTKALIETALTRFLDEVPALKQLNIVAGLELHGHGDTQIYRIEMPGPVVAKKLATDAKVTLEARRDVFNRLAEKGHVAQWRAAFEHGDVKATGIDQYLKLIRQVVEKQEERARGRRPREH
ncbi:MAG: hypothetical protein J2O48_00370 [Solirubrobacterales bacterium]|nr:hypothetical protein [Solirubrobacterales bacterium]